MPDLKEILLNKNVAIPEDYETFKKIFRHFKGKRVGEIEGDDGPLLERADEFYLKPQRRTGFLQGDILNNLPPVWVQKDENGDLDAFKSESGMAMVLSNECDCEPRLDHTSQFFVRLCPVTVQSDFLEGYDEKKKSDVLGKLERNFYTEYFWMPAPTKDDEPLIADMSHFYSVSLPDLYAKLDDGTVTKKISLSQEGYFLFMIKMAWFMLRPSAPDTARKNLEPWANLSL